MHLKDRKKADQYCLIYFAEKFLFRSVITGVRFKEYENLVFLQPQIGKLLPAGSVDPKRLSWMDFLINYSMDRMKDQTNKPTPRLENFAETFLSLIEFRNGFHKDVLEINFDDPSSYTFCLGKMHSGYDHTSVVTGEFNKVWKDKSCKE